MYCLHLYGLHVYCALVDLDSSGSPGVRPTPGLTSSTQVVCVRVRAYISTLKQTPLPIPPHTRMQVLRNTCDTRACSRAIEQYM